MQSDEDAARDDRYYALLDQALLACARFISHDLGRVRQPPSSSFNGYIAQILSINGLVSTHR